MKKLLENLRKQKQVDRNHRRTANTLTVISALIVFVIVYALILPAIAMNEETYCGLDAHEHSDSCYEQVLICQEEEHEHTDQCYDQEGNLVCDKDEHTHDDRCYEMELVCGKERHVHSKACYEKLTPEEVTEDTAAITNTSVSEASKREVSSDDEHAQPSEEAAEKAAVTEETPENLDDAGGTRIEKNVLASDGKNYKVTVTYGAEAGIPEGAELRVEEYLDGSEEYKDYCEAAMTAITIESLQQEGSSEARIDTVKELLFARFFEIGIWLGEEKIEPKASVEVKITYADAVELEVTPLTVIHFGEEETEILPADTVESEEGISEVIFETESFSTFATVSERINDSSVSESVIAFFNFDEIDSRGGFTSEVNGITAYATPIGAGATPTLAPAYDGNILELNDSNNDALSVVRADGSSLLTGLNQATISYWAYTTSTKTSWAFFASSDSIAPVYGNEHYIGAFHNSGVVTEERYYNGRGNNGNYSIQADASNAAWHYVTVVYDTNSTSVYIDGSLSGTKNGQIALSTILGNNSIFQIGKANWGGGEYFSGYLDEMMILNRALTADEVASLYGSGYSQEVMSEKQDKISITDLVNYALDNGQDTVTSGTVPEGSYQTAYAGKVLQDVIFYTTEYNSDEKAYDYYAVTHNGGLVKVSDLGSEIMWKDIRDIKWDLIVYTSTITPEDGPEQVVPSGYYELAYTDSEGTHFLAPQLNVDSFIQDGTLGLQFAGLAAGTYGTTIEAWDANDLEQVGLQILDDELFAATGRSSEVFYFARNTKEVDYTEPREVATVDSASKGIQIKMFDYSGTNTGDRLPWMTDLMGDGVYRSGHQVTLDLLKRNLDGGIPVASITGDTLTDLFSSNLVDGNANHLFLQGTYNETGYFSYNAAQNYACYNGGNFIVYDQAAAPSGTGTANYHGNFFPYNTFGEVSNSQLMLYDVNDTLLTPDNPEYGSSLLSLSNVNYFFGMEVSADFYQTKTGRDDYGNDIIYEFNGDDDLWVFIDDKLALDIGGIHGAIHGTINFTTGEIIVASENKYSVTGETSSQSTTAGGITTTLAEQFRKAYAEQGKSDAEITAILDNTFNKDGNGNYTSFKAYTTHNMKMFYMERGAGASNLNVKFNLPVVPPASFTIEKELPENVQSTYTDQKFAFKVYVQDGYESTTYTQITQDQVGEGKLILDSVYENTSTPAEFVDGILYLSPGEAVQLIIGEEWRNYYVEEVMLDSDLWEIVDINNAPTDIIIVDTDNNYGEVQTGPDLVSQRARIVFDNVPKNVQNLLINKVIETDDPESVDPTLTYEFYVYLEGRNGNLEAYSVGEYFLTQIIDGEKHYFNNAYTDLGTEPQICTYSGQNGSIGNIRAGYTIEIPGLLPGTDFYVVERANRIPEGYMFVRKTLTSGTYDPADNGIFLVQDSGNVSPDGKIKADADAEVVVTNSPLNKLRIYKSWADYGQVDAHGTVNVALYKQDGDTLTIVEGTLRTITPSMDPEYVEYILPGSDLSAYVVREVEVTGSGDEAVITPISNNAMIKILSETTGGVTKDNLYYAEYGDPDDKTETVQDGFGSDVQINVREDTITNTLPSLQLKKTDESGTKSLQGAIFELTDDQGTILHTLISDANGWLGYEEGSTPILTLYPGEGDYYLTETHAPDGYQLLPNRVKITVARNGITNIVESSTTMFPDKNTGVTVFEFDIPNTTGYELPNTGGLGTDRIYLLGSILLVFAGGGLLLKKRRRLM